MLIIGYGSIGKRHEEILLSFDSVRQIDIVTKQTLPNKITYKNLEEISVITKYDYYIIASETYAHHEQLRYLEDRLSNKLIFCEKPLFETDKHLMIVKNKVYVGYVLRFYPLMKKLKVLIKNEKVISVNVNCGQYLPTWRPDSDYKNSYSAKKEEGGGVLLDLSHEIDYVQWLFGKIYEIKSYQLKVSDLDIDSDDLTIIIGKTEKETVVNISLDYISKITTRRIFLHTLNDSYELDFINHRLLQKDKNGQENIYKADEVERNHMFTRMHQAILNNKESVCTYNEALSVMSTIAKVQEQNR